MNKKGKKRISTGTTNFLIVAVIAGVVLGVLWLGGVFDKSGTVTVDEVISAEKAICDVEDVTLTLSAFDKENPGTAIGNEIHRVWVLRDNGNGETWDFAGTVTDQGTLTSGLSTFSHIMVMYGNQTEDDGGFYATVEEYDIGCEGSVFKTGYVKDKPSANATLDAFNSDDGLINAAGDAQAVDANGEETMVIKVKATSEDYFGDGGVIIVFDANQNAFTDVILEGATEVAVPKQHPGVASSTSYAYEIPELVGSSRVNYDLTLKAGATEPADEHNITWAMYDKSYFINADTHLPEQGYNDEDNNNVGYGTPLGSIVIS